MKKSLKIVMDPFCFKQFDLASGAAYINFDKDEFTQKVNNYYLDVKEKGGLKNGYAPFCKHLFMENFTDCISYAIKIEPHNE
jgi:hypothetical protein